MVGRADQTSTPNAQAVARPTLTSVANNLTTTPQQKESVVRCCGAPPAALCPDKVCTRCKRKFGGATEILESHAPLHLLLTACYYN